MKTAHPLFVIGAGPKAASLSAKNKVLRDCKIKVPEVYVLESKEIAANWSGEHGYTSGMQRLGTPPEKDIGFPYRLDKKNEIITKNLLAEFSWISYLMSRGKFGQWIDRGRPHPTHKEWADYLSTVLNKSADRIIIGNVRKIVAIDDHWSLTVDVKDGGKRDFKASGIVFTGPGPRKVPRTLQLEEVRIEQHPRILFGDDFWTRLDTLNQIQAGDDEPAIVVVGGGETAASIVSYLIDKFSNRKISIVVLTRSGTLFSRGEGYYENRMFTEQATWQNLPETLRHEIINRGDRGVISVDAAKKIACSHNVEHRFMGVTKLSRDKGNDQLLWINGVLQCQLVVFALGFDAFWFRDLFEHNHRKIFSTEQSCTQIQETLRHDLSVTHHEIRGKLYLPMISAFAQGPGFPNLSCLGDLSDRILGRN